MPRKSKNPPIACQYFTGGVSPGTLKRYGAVREKHAKICAQHGITAWKEFDKAALEKYGNWLSKNFAYRTVYFELTLLKSVNGWPTLHSGPRPASGH